MQKVHSNLAVHFNFQRSVYQTAIMLCGLCCFNTWGQGVAAQTIYSEERDTPTCQIIAPNSGIYNYAQLHANQFQRTQPTELLPMTQTWQIHCDAPTTLTLQVTDKRSDSRPAIADATIFGLGMVNSTGRLGYYRLLLSHANIDTTNANLYQTQTGSDLEEVKTEFQLQAGRYYGWTFNNRVSAMAEHYSVNITTEPVLNSLKETNGPLVEGAELDGEAEILFTIGL